ncbi:MAG: UDP-glucose 4-epimerase GalE [Eubacteriales bacterium]
MKVLLTGGAGYIGSHIAVELYSAGHTAVIADNFVNSSPEAVARIEQITGHRIPLYEIDVCDKTALSELFEKERPDAVVHLAGLKAVGESVAKPLLYYRNNIDSTLSLLEVMAEYGCEKLIFSSSATVYGAPKTLPITEEAEAGGCTNPYGWTKYMIERIIEGAAAANPKLSAVLLRYFNPVGAHSSGLIGERPNGIPNNLMPYICKVAGGELAQLSVFGNDYNTHDGTGVRDYIHVVDLAKGHVAALGYCSDHTGTEIFNLGTGTGYSVLDMVKAFERANGVPVAYRITPRRPGDIDACYADPAKAEKLLGWKAELNLDDMCRDSWNWQKNSSGGKKA